MRPLNPAAFHFFFDIDNVLPYLTNPPCLGNPLPVGETDNEGSENEGAFAKANGNDYNTKVLPKYSTIITCKDGNVTMKR